MKRTLSVLLSVIIAMSCFSPAWAAESEAQTKDVSAGTGFSDVSEEDWFAPYVALCVEEGLMQGTGEGRFEPEKELTDPESLTLALRLYDLQRGGAGTLKTAPEDWYEEIPWWRDAYYTYSSLEDEAVKAAFEELLWFPEHLSVIIRDKYDPTSRLHFARALDAAAGELKSINQVEAIPDTKDQAVLHLYRAGILTGVDGRGTFQPDGSLTRAEAAAMLIRVVDPALRISFVPDADAAFAPFEEGGLYGLKDAAGNIRIPAQYAYLMLEEDGMVVVTDRRGNKGILDTDGTVVLPCLYPRIYNSPDELGLVVVGTNGDYASPLHYNGKKGMIDTQGNIVIPLQYDFLTPFENGQASFMRGEVFGRLLPDGTEVSMTAEEVSTDAPLYPLLWRLGLTGTQE